MCRSKSSWLQSWCTMPSRHLSCIRCRCVCFFKFSWCLFFPASNIRQSFKHLSNFQVQETASGWFFINRGCKLPVSFRIHLCQRLNPSIQSQSGAIADNLKYLNASNKKGGHRIRLSDSDFSNRIQKFPIPPITGDYNMYSICRI